MSEIDVLIKQSIGRTNCATFEVDWHCFGQQPTGQAANEWTIEKRQFIEDAIREKLERGI